MREKNVNNLKLMCADWVQFLGFVCECEKESELNGIPWNNSGT